MEVTLTTVPGVGVLHECTTRNGDQFAILVDHSDRRNLIVRDRSASDEPVTTILLEHDEADEVADMLHTRPIPDRLADLERRLTEIASSAKLRTPDPAHRGNDHSPVSPSKPPAGTTSGRRKPP